MFSLSQLSEQIAAVCDGRRQFGDFEDWFRAESRNAHLSNNRDLLDAVFSVEDVLSQYHAEGLRGVGLRRELENAIRPFVHEIGLHLQS